MKELPQWTARPSLIKEFSVYLWPAIKIYPCNVMPKLLVHTICCLTLHRLLPGPSKQVVETLPTGSHWVTFISIPKSAFSETQNSIFRVTKSGCGFQVQHFSPHSPLNSIGKLLNRNLKYHY